MKRFKKAAILGVLVTAVVLVLSLISAASAVWGS